MIAKVRRRSISSLRVATYGQLMYDFAFSSAKLLKKNELNNVSLRSNESLTYVFSM